MNYSDLAPPHIRAIAPYQPGKPIAELERELGVSGIVKLASNEDVYKRQTQGTSFGGRYACLDLQCDAAGRRADFDQLHERVR